MRSIDFRDPNVLRGGHVARRRMHLGRRAAPEVRDLFGTFVDEEHERADVRMIRGDRVRDLDQQRGLAGHRRRHDEAPLSATDRRDQIERAGGDLGGRRFESNPLERIDTGPELDLLQRRDVSDGDSRAALSGTPTGAGTTLLALGSVLGRTSGAILRVRIVAVVHAIADAARWATTLRAVARGSLLTTAAGVSRSGSAAGSTSGSARRTACVWLLRLAAGFGFSRSFAGARAAGTLIWAVRAQGISPAETDPAGMGFS
jgi:hypothetical protein